MCVCARTHTPQDFPFLSIWPTSLFVDAAAVVLHIIIQPRVGGNPILFFQILNIISFTHWPLLYLLLRHVSSYHLLVFNQLGLHPHPSWVVKMLRLFWASLSEGHTAEILLWLLLASAAACTCPAGGFYCGFIPSLPIVTSRWTFKRTSILDSFPPKPLYL